MPAPAQDSPLHPRNRHRAGLDFARLRAANPALSAFIGPNRYGNESIDFADPAAMKALNAALLDAYYGVAFWDIPAEYLCPSVPARADYLHTLADLLASDCGGAVPRGPGIRALDIGTGANCVYPLIGHREYGWRFLGSEIDAAALQSAARIVESNRLTKAIELRRQSSPDRVFAGLLRPAETFAVSLCNPPFFASAAEARQASQRKWKNLGKGARQPRNFGGQAAELWCPGGESAFVRKLVIESAREPLRCLWYSTLVSKSENLPGLRAALRAARALETRVVELRQGQKRSRIVAWTFVAPSERAGRLRDARGG